MSGMNYTCAAREEACGVPEVCQPDFRFLVRDRAGQFTASLAAVLADAGIEAVTIRPEARANAHAERFVLTARTEVTD